MYSYLRLGSVPISSAYSRSIKWSGACSALNSGSARDRQRSGSGPRYSISLIASGVRRNAGTSAGRLSAANRLIILCPTLPQPKEGGTASSGSRAKAAQLRRKADEFLFIPGVYRGSSTQDAKTAAFADKFTYFPCWNPVKR